MNSKNYLEFVRDLFGDDVYHDDPILKISDFQIEDDIPEDITAQPVLKNAMQVPSDPEGLESETLGHPDNVPQESLKPIVQSSDMALDNFQDMKEFYHAIKDCRKCKLCDHRNSFVFGKGNTKSDILIIGEAPGAEEDKQGIPFVGKAGQLLDKILAAVELTLEDVFITNIVKCRPPNNRDPEPDEIGSCQPYLKKQISMMNPKIILSLGRVSGRTLLGEDIALSKMRGHIHSYDGIPLVVTYHPSALLRNEAWKRPTWEDMKMFRKKYDELKGSA